MTNRNKQLSRRTVLRGMGVAMSLPWLEAMGTMTAWADEPKPTDKPEPRRTFAALAPMIARPASG